MSERADPRASEPHLRPFADGWSIWRWFCIRSAGFPIAGILRLVPDAFVAAVDAALGAEERAQAATKEARAAFQRAFGAADAAARLELRRGFNAALHAAERGRPFDGGALPGPIAEALERLRGACSEQTRAAGELAAQHAAAAELGHERLRELLAEPRFREALAWQNPSFLKDVAPLASPGARPLASQDRRTLRTLLKYAQRYLTKCDTIGFFGPMAWGVVRDEPAFAVTSGGGLSRRNVYFEHWAIDELARALAAAHPSARPWFGPRRHPGRDVHALLSAGERRVLDACDGERTAIAIAEALAAEPAPEPVAEPAPVPASDLASPPGTVAQVLDILAALAARSQIVWTLEVAVGTPWPERDLRVRLERVGDPAARAAMLAALAALEQRRDAVAAAAGDPDAVIAAQGALDEEFVRVTGAAPVRRGGETYAGRTLIYEDCVRELDAVVGDRWLAAVAPALSLLAHSARWYTHAVSTRYLALMRWLYGELRGAYGPSVPFPAFLTAWRPHGRAAPSLRSSGCPPLIQEIVDDLHARWAAILQLPAAGRRVQRSAAELEAQVRERFAAPHGGVPLFRYHSPDVMIAAASAEAIARGDFLAVLGELHTGNNTISPVFLKEHLERDQLIAARSADLPQTDVYPVVPKEHQSRATLFTFKDHDVMLELGDAVRVWPRDRVLQPAELVVEEDGGRLVVRCTRTGRTLDLWACFAYFLLASSTDHYSIVGDRTHTPRVTIDRLVIVRETWRFDARELAWCRQKRPVERFAAMHRWMRAHGLPRFVFVKVPSEKKPFFTDLYSVELAEIFALQASRAESVQLTEMLPGPDQVWLADPDGGRYVSELRLVLRDDRQGFGAPEGER